ncbi:MAG TPA: hypothetical protein VFF67_00620 [Thermoplasmata archaeon]|nr:hypothetical protein [Thermoplasmata archaeon]
MVARRSLSHRAAFGVGAFFLADVITGTAAYSVITLSSLWYFSISWIRLAALFAARGLPFGSAFQLDLAWIGTFVALPLAAFVVYLAIRAYRLPRALYRLPGRTTFIEARRALLQ